MKDKLFKIWEPLLYLVFLSLILMYVINIKRLDYKFLLSAFFLIIVSIYVIYEKLFEFKSKKEQQTLRVRYSVLNPSNFPPKNPKER